MAKWFRSEPMEYVSLIMNEDAAHDCLSNLGSLGAIQFTDLNPDLTPFQRRFVTYVKRCDELERKIRFFTGEIDKFGIDTVSTGDVNTFLSTPILTKDETKATSTQILENLETELEDFQTQLKELNTFSEKLTFEYNEKVELQEVLEKSRRFFMTDAPRLAAAQMPHATKGKSSEGLLEGHRPELDMRFSSITGVIASDERFRFERMVWRGTKGNCFLRFVPIKQPITDPATGELVEKSVFIIFFKSERIEIKLKKICDAFLAHRYSLPDMDDLGSVEKMLTDNAQELVDCRTILLKNQDTRYRLCQMLAKHVERWTWIVLKEKAVYHTLNMFKTDVSGMLRGEGWVVSEHMDEVKVTVEKAHSNMDNSMPSMVGHVPLPWPTPPTHFSTNKFTYGFQEFVNTYGIPRYREANPALFTAATFPFLFGVMYGDIGHGLFLFCVGLMLVLNEKKAEGKKMDELTEGMHLGRYMLFMMGFFAVYAGMIYNDCFSLGLNLFGSRWEYEGQHELEVEEGTTAAPTAEYGTNDSVYPFGLDPAWHVAGNELLFFNSFKMKLSVIFGIFQMFMGTMIKGMNALYFGERLDFLYEFIPMVVFACSLFMYMVFLIFYKWSTDWNSRMLSATCLDPAGEAWGSSAYKGEWAACEGEGYCTPWGYACQGGEDTATLCPLNYGGEGDGCQPPNLITSLINIALQPGYVSEPMFKGQAALQWVLLLLAGFSVPVLLLAKPYLLSQQSKGQAALQWVLLVPRQWVLLVTVFFLAKSYLLSQQSKGQAALQWVLLLAGFSVLVLLLAKPYLLSQQSHAPEHTDEEGAYHAEHDEDEEEHGFGEIVIHQAIETIEFVLGMVSNTASYLRLWALSLAHSELASVFWEKAMLTTLPLGGFATFIGFGIFGGVTFGVLLAMDVLECFLHALRLHWVEFQNKFFKADGIRFSPMSFQQLIKEAS